VENLGILSDEAMKKFLRFVEIFSNIKDKF